jgi:hypothetical protein
MSGLSSTSCAISAGTAFDVTVTGTAAANAIAFEAARLMYERTESEYFTAKRKAAKRLCRGSLKPEDLPSNAEIRDQIQALARFYGCPFINAVAEHDKDAKQFRNIALRHKKVVLAHIEKLAAEMGAAEPQMLAHQLALLIDGAIVAAAVLARDPAGGDLALPTT